MNGVIFHSDQRRVLKHHLHRGIELELLHLSRFRRVEQRLVEAVARVRVIEPQRGVIGEVGGVNPSDASEEGLQYGQLRRELE